MLKLQGVSIKFGGLLALSDVRLHVREGELVGVIGPNGAGKSTLFNLITGIYQPTEGAMTFQGRELGKLKPYAVVKSGIARTFQNMRLFEGMTVKEHVAIALQQKRHYSFWANLAATRVAAEKEAEISDLANACLERVGLAHQKNMLACHLPYGKQKKLEIIRALATEPKLLLLDEPAAGLNTAETLELSRLIRGLRDELQLTIIVIEHDMRFIMGLCERIAVLDGGKKIAEGSPAQIQSNPEVIRAYLGEERSSEEAEKPHFPQEKKAPLLRVQNISVSYGPLQALKNVSLHVCPGEIVTLIGANGAGKTTLLKAISGLIHSKQGEITFRGRGIGGMAPHEISARSLAHVPEGRGIFANLTVLENLEMGAYLLNNRLLKKNRMQHVLELFPQLASRLRQKGGTLSGGEQQMLSIGRALMREPSLLLLDEPSLGLAPQLVDSIFRLISKINEEGVSILLVEQNANMALRVANRAYVMETGSIVREGPAHELLKDPKIQHSYLGVE